MAAHLMTVSPTSLKVTLRALKEAQRRDFDSCLRMEYRLATRLAESHDFLEGVRAAVIDKDLQPRWAPGSLDAVSDADIERCFAPLGAAELTL